MGTKVIYFRLPTARGSPLEESGTLRRPVVTEHDAEHEVLLVGQIVEGVCVKAAYDLDAVVVTEEDIHSVLAEGVDAVTDFADGEAVFDEGLLGVIHGVEDEAT